MPHTKAPMASVKQSAPSKVPVLMVGDISPATMCQFEHACMNYFVHKKVITDNQVSLIIGGILDDCVGDWIVSDRARLIGISFEAFMIEFRTNYLAEDWEDSLHELLLMTQGSGTFWDYAITLQSKNSLLRGTTSHLLDDKLRHQLGAGMKVRLSKKVSAEKLNKITDFRKWLNEVKRCDDALRTDREEYERIAKDNRDSRRANDNNNSNEPSSRRVPNNNAAPASLSSAPSTP